MIMKIFIVAVLFVGAVSGSCTDDAGCSLNGVCNTATSTCTCDPGWTSAGAAALGTPDCGTYAVLWR